jgi:hypothetical protein
MSIKARVDCQSLNLGFIFYCVYLVSSTCVKVLLCMHVHVWLDKEIKTLMPNSNRKYGQKELVRTSFCDVHLTQFVFLIQFIRTLNWNVGWKSKLPFRSLFQSILLKFKSIFLLQINFFLLIYYVKNKFKKIKKYIILMFFQTIKYKHSNFSDARAVGLKDYTIKLSCQRIYFLLIKSISRVYLNELKGSWVLFLHLSWGEKHQIRADADRPQAGALIQWECSNHRRVRYKTTQLGYQFVRWRMTLQSRSWNIKCNIFERACDSCSSSDSDLTSRQDNNAKRMLAHFHN